MTSDEFSPKKLSGVFRVGLIDLLAIDVVAVVVGGDLRSKSVGANGSAAAAVDRDESFHGFVDVGLDATAPMPPKKSPNGSSFDFCWWLFVVVVVC